MLSDRDPADKVEAAVAFEQQLHPTLMVGDGINDAPALACRRTSVHRHGRARRQRFSPRKPLMSSSWFFLSTGWTGCFGRGRHRPRKGVRQGIAMQSIIVGLALSGIAMLAAAFGWLSPVAAALSQEAIDVAVILKCDCAR